MSNHPDSLFENYLRDLGYLLKEAALESKQSFSELKQSESSNEVNESFASGRALAYYEVISLMKQQAKAFSIEHSKLALSDLDPDKDLL